MRDRSITHRLTYSLKAVLYNGIIPVRTIDRLCFRKRAVGQSNNSCVREMVMSESSRFFRSSALIDARWRVAGHFSERISFQLS